MSAYSEGKWMALAPVRIVKQVRTLPRNRTHIVVQHHRGWAGIVARQTPGRPAKPQYERCLHAHSKLGAARQCGERLARHLNRGGNHVYTPQGEGQ